VSVERNWKEAELAVAVAAVLRFFETIGSVEEASSIGTIVRTHRLHSLIFLLILSFYFEMG